MARLDGGLGDGGAREVVDEVGDPHDGTQAREGSEQGALGRLGAVHPEMGIGPLGGDATSRGALQEPRLEEERLVGVLDGLGLFADGDGQRGQPDRAATEPSSLPTNT